VAGNYSDDVEQKNEQVIGVSHCCRKRLVMDNFKVNQPRSASPLVVNDIRHARVTVRPRAGAALPITANKSCNLAVFDVCFREYA
jgi:hypothetical protein